MPATIARSNAFLSQLKIAGTRFSDLARRSCGAPDETARSSRGDYRHFLVLGCAITILSSYRRDQLEEFEARNLVHGSTISGGSLDIAIGCLQRYFGQEERNFTWHDYEQLQRVCSSARSLLLSPPYTT